MSLQLLKACVTEARDIGRLHQIRTRADIYPLNFSAMLVYRQTLIHIHRKRSKALSMIVLAFAPAKRIFMHPSEGVPKCSILILYPQSDHIPASGGTTRRAINPELRDETFAQNQSHLDLCRVLSNP